MSCRGRAHEAAGTNDSFTPRDVIAHENELTGIGYADARMNTYKLGAMIYHLNAGHANA